MHVGHNVLEVHDSFYVASDVFYTFLVRNGCWCVRRQLKDPDFFLLGCRTGAPTHYHRYISRGDRGAVCANAGLFWTVSDHCAFQ